MKFKEIIKKAEQDCKCSDVKQREYMMIGYLGQWIENLLSEKKRKKRKP